MLLVEDCSQAHGAEINGKKVGSVGDYGVFSFYPTKNLGSFGDGGIITMNDKRKYNAIKMLRNYGHDRRCYNI